VRERWAQARSAESVDAEPEVVVLEGFAEIRGDHQQARSLEPVRHFHDHGLIGHEVTMTDRTVQPGAALACLSGTAQNAFGQAVSATAPSRTSR
jgi:hypothetical protein